MSGYNRSVSAITEDFLEELMSWTSSTQYQDERFT